MNQIKEGIKVLCNDFHGKMTYPCRSVEEKCWQAILVLLEVPHQFDIAQIPCVLSV